MKEVGGGELNSEHHQHNAVKTSTAHGSIMRIPKY